jgi:hypothetical protein
MEVILIKNITLQKIEHKIQLLEIRTLMNLNHIIKEIQF